MIRMTQFKTASPMLGVFKKENPLLYQRMNRFLVLDQISDRNLGTILRQASWFGIQHVLCSEQSVDCYNSKVVQASMGGMARVYCHYGNLVAFYQVHNYLSSVLAFRVNLFMRLKLKGQQFTLY